MNDPLGETTTCQIGGDDSPRMQAAVNRLSAISGGTLRLSAGDYLPGQQFWIDDTSVEAWEDDGGPVHNPQRIQTMNYDDI